MDINKLKWVLPITLASFSVTTFAQGDARGDGMGGTGVASANYLTSSFHNPARAASFDDDDDFGMILPAVSVSAQNVSTFVDKVDAFTAANDALDAADEDTIEELQDDWLTAFNDLGNEEIYAQASLGLVIAIPNQYVSVNLFSLTEISAMVISNLDVSDIDDFDAADSTIDTLAGGHLDIGLTFANSFEIAGQVISLGVSPKIQQLYAYSETIDIFSYDQDFDYDYNKKSTFNLDLGINYEVIPSLELGFVAKNIISHELKTEDDLTYQLEPTYIAGVAFNTELFTVAMDIDLNSAQLFEEYDNDTQFANFGAEFNALNWAQVRVGYRYSMTDYSSDIYTAGLGFQPFGLVGFDIAGMYGTDDNYGLTAQLFINL